MSGKLSEEKTSQGRGWSTMIIFWLGLALSQVLIYGLGLVLPGMMEDLQFDTVKAGTLGAIGYFTCFLFLTPFSGFLIRFPPKRTLGFMFIGITLVFVLSALAPSYSFLLVVRAVGIILTVALSSVVALLQRQWFEPRQMGSINGLQNGMTTIGQIIGLSVIPAMLAGFGGWRGTYNIVAVAIGIITVIWFIFGKENRTAEYEASMAGKKKTGATLKDVLKRKEFLLMGFGIGGAVIAYIAFLTFWPTYATQVKGLDITAVGKIMGVVAFGSLAGSLLSGVISDKIGLRKPQIILATLLLPVAYFALLKLDSVVGLSIAFFFVGFLAFFYSPLLFTIAFELKEIKPQEISVGISVILSLSQLGMGLGSQLAGIAIDNLGPAKGLSVLLFTPLIMTILILFVPETGPKAKKKETLESPAEPAA
jgi:predicted MFS family arabinose efflux permease